jgi:hypothetical protein
MYAKQTWTNGAAGGTKINGPRLQHIEDGIEAVSAAVDGMTSYTDSQAVSAVNTNLVAGSGISKSFASGQITLSVTASGTSTTSDFGAVLLDSFTGADDDAKLDSALSTLAAETYPRTLLLTNRQYTFATVNRVPFEGMRIRGPHGYSNPERSSASKSPNRVRLTGTGAWFTATSQVFQVSFSNLSFTGGTNAWVLGSTSDSVGNWYCLQMRDIFTSGLKSVIGSQAQKVLITAAQFDGAWEINNCYNGAFHLGGSDNTLWPAGMLLDSGTAFNTAGSANGQYHIWCDFLEKSYIGPIYVTCEGAWNGVRVSGPAFNTTASNQGGPLVFHGSRIEGRNENAPCNGSVVRQEGGMVILRDCWIGYGMASPTTPGHTPADAGMVHHSGGTLIVDGCTYDRATGVAETVPFVYTSSTGDCMVSKTMHGATTGAWTGRPRVGLKTGNTENRIVDATVTNITV